MAYKFTFKAQKQGLWDLCKNIDIKYRGKNIGYIVSKPGEKCVIRVKVPASEKALEKNPNCPWMWANIKLKFDTEKEAKDWINEKRELILPDLYFEQTEMEA